MYPVIWVISDTHLTSARSLPEVFISRINPGDLLIHLGDIVSSGVLDHLEALCRVEAICGNCDRPDLRRRLPSRKILEIEGRRIGLYHGRGGPGATLSSVQQEFQDIPVDIVLFGHTHVPYHRMRGNILFFNPGSLGDGRAGISTLGILHLEQQPWGEVIEI